MFKNKVFLATLAILAALSMSVKADTSVTASILGPADNQVALTGEAVHFGAEATGGSAPYAYVWDFGDGTTGSGQSFDKTFNTAGTRTITLTVTDFSLPPQTSSVSHTLVINNPTPAAPTVDLKINNSDGPLTVSVSSTLALTWSTTHATDCTASGNWSGSKSIGDSEITTELAPGSYTYTLTCTGAGGTANDTVAVTVSQPTITPIPAVNLKVNGSNGPVSLATNTSFTLSWTSANVSNCTASGDWSGTKSITAGSEATTTPGMASAKTYTLTCDGANGSVSDSVTVNTTTGGGDNGPVAPVITNLRITDIGVHSVIVRWTTDKAVDSRVIYDTVSHPDISGQSEPNFGYANSTDTIDGSAKVTEHAVTVSGLSAATTYYFRALSR